MLRVRIARGVSADEVKAFGGTLILSEEDFLRAEERREVDIVRNATPSRSKEHAHSAPLAPLSASEVLALDRVVARHRESVVFLHDEATAKGTQELTGDLRDACREFGHAERAAFAALGIARLPWIAEARVTRPTRDEGGLRVAESDEVVWRVKKELRDTGANPPDGSDVRCVGVESAQWRSKSLT